MGTLLGIVLVILAAYSVRKLFTAASEPVKLPPDGNSAQSAGSSPPEGVVAEVLVKTGDLKHHPIRITYPHNDEGRLVLTNLRLLYLSYDQKSTTLMLPLRDISQVEAGEKKGFLTSTPAVTVIYRKDGRDRRTTWSVPPEMIDYGGIFMGTKRQANRHTAGEFADLLNRERASPSQTGAQRGSDKPDRGDIKEALSGRGAALVVRNVRVLDDALVVYQERDFHSAVIDHPTKGSEIQIASQSEVEGREWFEAVLPNGIRGYVLAASVRSHTT